MSEAFNMARSPDLMCATDTALVVVDVQEKLLPVIGQGQHVLWNIGRLLDGAKLLALPVLSTEQYPKGLGATVAELGNRLPARGHEKLAFSCTGCADFLTQLQSLPVGKILLTGIETHVCVQQTALDLVAEGYRVLVAVDAVGARKALDHDVALRRMESAGVTLTTTEAALFEWCQVAGTPQFKQISALVRQSGPEA